MMKSEICSGCGKLIDHDYYFCPWCGLSRISIKDESSMELRYRQFQQRKAEGRRMQLEKMNEELNNLEQELSVLVLSAEMHK